MYLARRQSGCTLFMEYSCSSYRFRPGFGLHAACVAQLAPRRLFAFGRHVDVDPRQLLLSHLHTEKIVPSQHSRSRGADQDCPRKLTGGRFHVSTVAWRCVRAIRFSPYWPSLRTSTPILVSASLELSLCISTYDKHYNRGIRKESDPTYTHRKEFAYTIRSRSAEV